MSVCNVIDYDEIYDYLFISTPIKPADLLIVFGATYGINEYVNGICDILYKKLIHTILFTGKNESKNIYKLLAQRNKSILNKVKVLIENKSTNTGENLKFSLPLLRKEFGNVENIGSIIGLGKDFAARRFLMTMEKYFPTAEKMFYPVNVFHCDESNWYKDDVLYQKCMNECKKIPIYLQKGFIINNNYD